MDLKRLYTDPKFSGAFSGKQRFLKALKSQDRRIKKSDVEKLLDLSILMVYIDL